MSSALVRWIALCLVLISGSFATPTASRAAQASLLIPAYGNPGNSDGAAMWDALIETAADIGPDLLVILNPNSGPGAPPIDPNYVGPSGDGPFIDFRQAGGVAIGYVRTDYANRPLADVQAEIDLYLDPVYWRGAGVQIDGFFFDEMSNALVDVGYYQNLRDFVRSRLPQAIVVGNPGTSFVDTSGQPTFSIEDYVESVDVLVTFETVATEYAPGVYTPPSWLDDYPAERFGHIVYHVDDASQTLSTVSLAIARKAGFIYVTDDHLSNPYDRLPGEWSRLVEAAQGLLFADGFETGDSDTWD